ncbi:MAG TPA: ribosome small subunit-dependent GTPase A [Bacillota bacterium]|nr:ribosome small subunit-dependent GTPase A [Bacillota bacterium]
MELLAPFGWTDAFQKKWQALDVPGLVPARVVADFGTSLRVATPDMVTAETSGSIAHYANRDGVPKVGDWVAVRLLNNSNAVIEALIPRRSEIARKVAGKQTKKQVIAANVDVAFVLLALDSDFSVERLKRFLYQLSVSQIDPVIVLNKADKAGDLKPYLNSLDSLGLPVIVSTATEGAGVAEILAHIGPGQTAILLGSSGVGKSTLTNALLQRDVQATQAVRQSDDTGQHTTVHRELFVLPNGGLLIDTPGIRELQLWGTQEDLDNNFDDIAALASQCKYATCRHGNEPGCAVQAALRNGTLQAAHYADYTKMKAELHSLENKTTVQARQTNKRSRKSINRQARDRLGDEE